MVSAFAAQGARVAFVDIAQEASRALAAQIAAAGHPAPWWRRCDVRDIASLQGAIADAAAALGDFAVLVNNVASDDRHSLASVTPAYYDDRMAINERPALLRDPVGGAGHAAPGLRLGRQPGLRPAGSGKGSGYPCYAIAKSSVNGLTRGLAVEPGARPHPHQHGVARLGHDRAAGPAVAGRRRRGGARAQPVPARPAACRDDIARMVLFLASDDAAMCTAQEFKVDAGWV